MDVPDLNEAQTGVDGDCARGDDDSEAFAMRSEDRTSEQFLGVTQPAPSRDNVISLGS